MAQNKDRIICRCEEITEEEIRNAILAGHTTIKAVKRATRAGMGFCQGRTCGPLVREIISSITGDAKEDIPADTARYPLFPLKLEKLAEESSDCKE